MEDKILVNLSADHTFECATDIIGREGEGNTSRFAITIPEKLIGCSVYLDFKKPNGEKLRTPKLKMENGVAVYDVVPYLLTDGGQIKAQAVLITENGQTWKSSKKTYTIHKSINALEEIPKKEDIISEVQIALENLSKAEGIASIEQTTISAEDGGDNIITITTTSGNKYEVALRNGSKGDRGDKGDAYLLRPEDIKEIATLVLVDFPRWVGGEY